MLVFAAEASDVGLHEFAGAVCGGVDLFEKFYAAGFFLFGVEGGFFGSAVEHGLDEVV